MPANPKTDGKSNTPEHLLQEALPSSVEGNKYDHDRSGEGRGRRVQRTVEKPSHWWETAPSICAILLVIITGYYTYYAKQQAGAAITAADAAKSAADTASSTLKEMQTGQGATDTHTLAVAAGEQAEFSGKQVSGIKESNRINRESLEAVQRAFITFQDIYAPRWQKKGVSSYAFSPAFQNSGVTPAKVIASSFGSNIENEPTETEFIGKADFTPITIGPKATQPVGPVRIENESNILVEGFGETIQPRELETKENIVIWAWISYRDILPGTKLHLTEFCDGTVGAFVNQLGQVRFQSRSCGRHNCTDEDCEDYKQIATIVLRGPRGDKHPLRTKMPNPPTP
jgi:hypothetical protein